MQNSTNDAGLIWQPSDLQNNLIRLVPLRTGDFEALYQVASDPLIWEQHPSNDRYKREVFESFFAGALASCTAFLVFDQVSGDLIGSSRYYDDDPGDKKIAIGFTFLARKYWGGAYNRALKSLMLDYAFRYADTVVFHIGAGNIRSQKAILKLGARLVAVTDVDHNGNKEQRHVYVIEKSVWMK
jgi:RimJ/RimL family protein N-acetyltransferase